MPATTSPSRYTVENLNSGLRITIPSRKTGIQSLFSGMMLLNLAITWIGIGICTLIPILMMFACAAFIFDSSQINWHDLKMSGLVMLIIFGVPPVILLGAGFPALYIFLWRLSGKEVVDIDPQGISVRRQLLGVGRRKTYPTRSIQSMRVLPSKITNSGLILADVAENVVLDQLKEQTGVRLRSSGYFIRNSLRNLSNGSIEVIYNDDRARAFSFGVELAEDEARQIVHTIQQHFSQYSFAQPEEFTQSGGE